MRASVGSLPAAAGVICEFNPFHNGHATLLATMRDAVGSDGCVVCVMSGRFVQRGDPAIADPYLRGRLALLGGADLVLELPFPWSAAGAEDFARGGVSILCRMGVRQLAFGSETGDIALLTAAADALDTPGFPDACAAGMVEGQGTAAAFAGALRAALSDDLPALPENFPGANDLLGLQYLRAIRALGGTMAPLVIHRAGQAYRDTLLHDPAAPSAGALRPLIRAAAEDPECLAAMLDGTMPPPVLEALLESIRHGDVPVREDALLPYLHGLFRMGHSETLRGIAGLSGGLAERMIRAAQDAGTPEAFLQKLHTRLYPDARLRRGMLFAAAGVAPEDVATLPGYTTLLAANATGCRYVKALRGMPHIPVITKPADAPAGRQRMLSDRADALFTLCLPTAVDAGALYRCRPFIQPF